MTILKPFKTLLKDIFKKKIYVRGYIIYIRAINHIMIFLNYYKLIAYCLNMDYHNGIINVM